MSTEMTHSAAHALGEYLTQQSQLTGYVLRINGGTSEVGHQACTITDTSSRGIQRSMSGATYELPGVQIIVRGKPGDQMTPRTKLVDLSDFVSRIVRVDFTIGASSYRIGVVNRTSALLPFPVDSEKRWAWAWNGTLSIVQTV